MFQRGYGMPQVAQNHQKHAQSTYLDEYLWFKKYLVEKFRLDNFLEYFHFAKKNFFHKIILDPTF